VDEVLDLIADETLETYPLFAETCRQIDFNQFTPRGHHIKTEELRQYFRAMMWLGRTELYLLAPESTHMLALPVAHTQRRAAANHRRGLAARFDGSARGQRDLYGNVLSCLAGEQDSLRRTGHELLRIHDDRLPAIDGWETTYPSQATRRTWTASCLANEVGEDSSPGGGAAGH
jgi:hypothetical protein